MMKLTCSTHCCSKKLNQGNEHTYYSWDYAIPINESSTFDLAHCILEYLHSLNFNDIPPHALTLKVGSPKMLLRNIDQSLCLCNGTRLIVKSLQDKVIDAEIITGSHIGK